MATSISSKCRAAGCLEEEEVREGNTAFIPLRVVDWKGDHVSGVRQRQPRDVTGVTIASSASIKAAVLPVS